MSKILQHYLCVQVFLQLIILRFSVVTAQQLNNLKHSHLKVFTRKKFNTSMMSQKALIARTKTAVEEQKTLVNVFKLNE